MISTLRSILREPMVSFLGVGGALFLLFQGSGSGGRGSDRIIVTSAHVEHLALGFTRTWQRPPTEGELKALIDDHVREEIAAREARALGLDRDDTLVRRRLRQKLEFFVEDDVMATPPSNAELQTWLDQHPGSFRRDPEVAFRHVHVSPALRGPAAAADARQLLARLATLAPGADVSTLGDPLRLLPGEVELSSHREVARLFGDNFADAVLRLSPGHWAGPIESGFGLHLVLVTQHTPGRLPTLAEVRDAVVRDVLAVRRTERLAAMYRQLLERYPVVIETANPGPTSRAAAR